MNDVVGEGAGPRTAPLGLDELPALADRIAASRPAFFLDYDGTLTPIMARPELAVLDPAMRDRLDRLRRACPVALVSGRDLEDVRALVGLDGVIYAGSHGLDIDAPSGRQMLADAFRPALERATRRLRAALANVEGALVEPKRFAVSVHTRQVDPARKPTVEKAVRDALAAEPDLSYMGGKELHELRPDMDWDKGRAILHLIEAEGLGDRLAVCIGDDVTDEDAFRALRGRGLSLHVAGAGIATVADMVLPDIPAAGRLIDLVLERLRG